MDRKKYFAALKEIRERYKAIKPGEYDPYLVFDWVTILSPIERIVWGDLRYYGLRFYPQYPVGRYFIDFADPETMVGLEVDGEKYHRDREKDERRQKELEKLGWKIVRIAGFETMEKHENYIHNVLRAIGWRRAMPQFEEKDDCGEQWDQEEILEN